MKDTKMKKLDRTKIPFCDGFADIKFPEVYENTLANGMNILVLEDRKIPIVSTMLLFKSGSIHDSLIGENKSGTASLVSELITKGTKTRNAEEIAEEIEFLGADLNSNCNFDSMFVSAKSLTKYFGEVFDIVTDVVQNPLFEQEEMNRLKTQRLNNLLYYNDHGKYLSSKLFIKQVHKNSPYSNTSMGSFSSIENLTNEDILTFYKKFFHSGNLTMAFIGDISPEVAYNLAAAKFNNWQPEKFTEINVTKDNLSKNNEIYIIDKKDFVQSDIYIGHLSVPVKNPDYIMMLLLNTIIGGTFTSRLNKRLREKSGYTYGISSSFNMKKHTGEFLARTSVNTEVTANSIGIIIDELISIVSKQVLKEELDNAKNYIKGSFPLQMETSNSIASSVLRLKFYELEKDFYNTLFSKMEKITVEDIHETAKKHIHPENVIISIAGNAERISKSMEQFGNVSVLNNINF